MTKENKTYLIIGICVLVFLIVLSYFFYRAGKKTVTIQTVPADVPGSNNANNNPTGASNTEIKLMVDALYKDMDGVNFLVRDMETYQKFLSYSDTDTVRVYNAFNTEHQKDSGETLKVWLEGESGFTAFNVLRDSILAKFAKLNLK